MLWQIEKEQYEFSGFGEHGALYGIRIDQCFLK